MRRSKSGIAHCGPQPSHGDAEKILRGNALGTVNINDAFYEVMAPGGCVIDTSSMSAYLAPQFVMPKGAYKLARTDREKFIKKLVARAASPLRTPARVWPTPSASIL